MTVTWVPKRERMEANSMPMTPAPMMNIWVGNDWKSSAWVEVMTRGLVMPSTGGSLALEPVAMMMSSAS